MNRDNRRDRMLGSLPLLLQEGANVSALFGRLADVFSGASAVGGVEYGLTRLLRSRWHRDAQGWTDERTANASELGQLGVLFGFPPARGERVDAFRRRIVEYIAIHRDGLTTADAILRLVALVYQAEGAPKITYPSDQITTAEFIADAGGELAPIHVALRDNPVLPASARFHSVNHDQRLVMRNAGLDPAIPEVSLTPIDQPAKVPVLVDHATGLRLIYVGVVPAGATLTLRDGRPPLIDGIPQSAPVLLLNPFSFNHDTVFGGVDEVYTRFSIASRDFAMSPLAPGENHWGYYVLPQNTLRDLLLSWPELAPLEELADPGPTAPATDITLEWQESSPASIALHLPADRIPRAFEGDLADFIHELEWALAHGSAAGIRARVELTLPHVRERVELRERLSLTPAARFADAPTLDDPLTPRQELRFSDAVDGPSDEGLEFGGRFGTPFNTSHFE